MTKQNGRVKIGKQTAPKTPARSVFVNSAGRSYPITGISPFTLDQIKIDLAERWRLDGHPLLSSPPPVPTYEIETVGGGKETFEMDKESLETEEEKIKWNLYQAELKFYQGVLASFESEYNQQLSKESFPAVDVDPKVDKEWIAWCQYREMSLPEHRFELKELYVKTQVVRSVSDIPRLMSAVMITSELATEEATKTVEASFQRQLSAALKPANTPE